MGKKVTEDYRAGYRVARGFHEGQRDWAVDYDRLLDGSSDDFRVGFMAYVGNHVGRSPAPAGHARKDHA